MDGYQCWWCKLFYSKEGHFCFLEGKPDNEFTESDEKELEKLADKLEAAIKNQNLTRENFGYSNSEIQENIQLNRSPRRYRNSKRSSSSRDGAVFTCDNPSLTNCQKNSFYLSDSLDNTQNGNFEKSEGSSGSSFSVPSSEELCQEDVSKSNPSKDASLKKKSRGSNAITAATKKLKLSAADLGSKEDSLDSTSVSAMCEQRKEIAVSAKKMKEFRSVSSSLAMETPIDGSSVKENELSEEVVEFGTVADAGAVSVAGPSGLQAQPLRRSRVKHFECDVKTCGKFFRSRYHLEAHHRTHTGEKPFVCNICNKGFGQKDHLKNHQVTHTGEKTFQCRICLKKFGLKGNLKMHLQTHLDKKPFVCSMCSKGFTQNGQLKRHLLTHSG